MKAPNHVFVFDSVSSNRHVAKLLASRVWSEYQHINRFNHWLWSAFLRGGALELGLASLEFGVGEQHERGVRS
jgi:hypothetical protein